MMNIPVNNEVMLGRSDLCALKLDKPPGGRLPVLSAYYVPVNDSCSS